MIDTLSSRRDFLSYMTSLVTVSGAALIKGTPDFKLPELPKEDFSKPSSQIARHADYVPYVKISRHQDKEAIDDLLRLCRNGDDFMQTFGRKIIDNPMRNEIWNIIVEDFMPEDRHRRVLEKYGKNHPDYYPLMEYDESWMYKFYCHDYVFYLLRREGVTIDTEQIINHPQQNLDSQYLPVFEPQDFDVVGYYLREPSIGHWDLLHIGMYYNGNVISKNNVGNVYSHGLFCSEGFPDLERQRVVFFRKFGEEDPRNLPFPQTRPACLFQDWEYRHGAVSRKW